MLAKVDLTFHPIKQIDLKAGTSVSTEIDLTGKRIDFELDEDITVIPVTLKKVIVDEKTGVFDRTEANEKVDTFYAPFGLNIQKDCTLFLGFEMNTGLNIDALSFMCYLYEKDMNDNQPGKHGYEFESDYKFVNAKLKWEYSSGENKWRKVIPEDRSDGFKKRGRIIFKDLNGWEQSNGPGGRFFWIKCIIDESHYEYPPRIDTIMINTVSATQGKTIRNEHEGTADEYEKRQSSGLPHWFFKVKNTGIIDKTVKLEFDEYIFSWNEIPENKDAYNDLRVYLKNRFSADWVQNSEIQKTDKNTIKLYYENNYILLELDTEEMSVNLMTSDGTAYRFVAKKTKENIIQIYDGIWKEVDDFDSSGPQDNHFIVDRENGTIQFGDGLNGRVPPAGSQISIVEYKVEGRLEGNIKEGYTWKIESPYGLNISEIRNYEPSTGGKAAESIEEAANRFIKDLKVPYTGVTSFDFEKIAKNTPGLRVAKVKAIPENVYNGKNGHVTVVIIPYFPPIEDIKTPPLPSDGFRNAICRHLDKHRLLGTKISIVPPQYVIVKVSVTVVPHKGIDNNKLKENISKEIKYFLDPIRGGIDGNGWEIGRLIPRSEIFDLLEKIEGVNCVTMLKLSGVTMSEGQVVKPDNETGNLNLPSRIATIFPGDVEVIIQEYEKCR